MNDTPTEKMSSPGLILKAAREERELSIEKVAHELHLRPSVVRAIEDENYTEFNSDVFLKGYFRTYCRLLNLNETLMIELLEAQLLLRKKCELQQESFQNKLMSSQRRKRILKKLSIILLCIAVFVISYISYNNSTSLDQSNIEDDQTEIIPQALSDIDKRDVAQENTTQNDITQTDSLNNSISTETDQTISNTPPVTPSTEESIVETQLQSLGNSSEIPDIDDPDSQNVESDDDSIKVSLKAVFSGDCWFKVTDSRGKTLAAALKKMGQEVNITGSAPFHIVIGDASKVALFFEDNEVNTRPFTSSNGRAELTLKSSEAQQEG